MILRGHVPEAAAAPPVAAALRAHLGGDIPVVDALRVLPRPTCHLLDRIETLGLPQSTEHLTNPKVVGAEGFARVYDVTEGEFLELSVAIEDSPAAYAGWAHIDYFDGNGMVVHLLPNAVLDPVRLTPGASFSIGAADSALPLQVAAPFRREIAVAFVTTTPIALETRPIREAAGPYLDWRRAEIAAAREADPAFKGEWFYMFVSPSAK